MTLERLSPTAQASLLRVLDKMEIAPLGGQVKKLNFRVVAATNEDLEQMVKAGTFREDLLARINAKTLSVPSLRERKEDIPLLVQEILHKESAGRMSIASDVLRIFENFDWPQNIRQLKNTLRSMIASSPGEMMTLAHLPENFFDATVIGHIQRELKNQFSMNFLKTQLMRKHLESYCRQ